MIEPPPPDNLVCYATDMWMWLRRHYELVAKLDEVRDMKQLNMPEYMQLRWLLERIERKEL